MVNISELPRYETYKNSGVNWLGDIPTNWDCVQFRNIAFRFSNGTTANQLEYDFSDFPVSRIETISSGNIDYSKVGYLKNGTKY